MLLRLGFKKMRMNKDRREADIGTANDYKMLFFFFNVTKNVSIQKLDARK